jgi:hypothetical protein
MILASSKDFSMDKHAVTSVPKDELQKVIEVMNML